MNINRPLRRQRIGFLSLVMLLCLGVFSFFNLNIIQAQFADNMLESPLKESEPAAFVDGGFNPVVDGSSAFMAQTVVQPDGKILVGGDFSALNGTSKNGIARFNADGTLDMAFNTGSGANDAIFGIGLQSDGKIVISGLFTNFNGVTVGRIARLNADGTIDQTFNTVGVGQNSNAGANSEISEVKILSDGKMLIGGTFTNYNGTAQNRLARLNSNGSLDTSFTVGTGPNSTVLSIDVQADGKAIIGGNFVTYNATPAQRVARINTDGSLDTSFSTGAGADFTVRKVIAQTDGKVIIAGLFAAYAGIPANGIARLESNGNVDQTFTVAGMDATIFGVAIQTDGKYVVGGGFTAIAGSNRASSARLNTNGTLDATYDPGTGTNPGVIQDLTLQTDGKVIIVGTFTAYNGTTRGGVARANSNGSLDATMPVTSSTFVNINAVAVQSDGKIIIGGLFPSVGGTARSNIARLNADGTLDTTFNPGTGASSTVQSLAIQTDGKILVGGGFATFNGAASLRLARLNADGSLDTTFTVGTGASSDVNAIVPLSDGKILIGGAFVTYNGTTGVNRFARLNANGTLDTTFTTGTSSNGTVRSIVLQADNKIVIGGAFTTYNAVGRNRIARVNADGTLDTTFNVGTGATNTIASVALQTDGKILIGGLFASFNGTARNRIARLNTDGTHDLGFDPGAGANADVNQIIALSGGKTLIAGNFVTFNGLPRNRVARLNANGSFDATFTTGLGANAAIRALVQQADGKLLAGGIFDIFNVNARTGIARFSNTTDTFQDFDGDGKSDFGVIRRAGVISPWTWWISNSSNGAVSTFNFGLSTNDIPQPGDFDGDGKDDIAMWRNTPQAGQVSAYYIVQSATNTVRIIPFGQSGDVPLVEDYDGDGKDDLSVWRANSPAQGVGQATWYYLGSLNNPNNNITYVSWGIRYGTQADQVDEPYPGDFDGDGRADFTIQRRSDTSITTLSTPATFHTLTASGNLLYINDFGFAGDRIVPGDYDGDGRTDIAVARGFNLNPGNTTWYIRYSSGIADSSTLFGRGFNFAQGDYDGDGKTDIGYFITGTPTGFWYLSSANAQTANFFLWGVAPTPGVPGSGDLPIASYNNR